MLSLIFIQQSIFKLFFGKLNKKTQVYKNPAPIPGYAAMPAVLPLLEHRNPPTARRCP